MKQFFVTAHDPRQLIEDLGYKGEAVAYRFDFSPWFEGRDNVTSVTWTVKKGLVSIGSKNLSSNVASSVIEFTRSGKAAIDIVATNGTDTIMITLSIRIKFAVSPAFESSGTPFTWGDGTAVTWGDGTAVTSGGD